MNTLKTIYNKLGKEEKTELKSEKIELNILKDIKSAQQTIRKKVVKARNNAISVEKEFKAVNSQNEKLATELESERKRIFNVLSDAKNKAKDLGLELPREFYDRYDQLAEDIRQVPVSNLANVFPI